MAALRIESLFQRRGASMVLQDIDLSVEAGSLMAILGASGSGKTTLLRSICGFERPDAGRILIGGAPMVDGATIVPPEQRRIGYVAQEGALFPHLSIADNIVFGLPRGQRRARARVGELLELVGLPGNYADRPPQSLSGGEQQRVAVARALAPAPALVLLDEPFSSLDAALRLETRQAVAAALAGAGATAVLVTHDQGEALSLGRQVAVLRGGRFVQVAPPRDLYCRPIDLETACFVGEATILPGEARGGRATCVLGDLPLVNAAPDGPVDLVIRPEQIRVVEAAEGAGVLVRVTAIVFSGHESRISLRTVEGDPPADLAAMVFSHRSPQPDAVLRVVVDGPVSAFAFTPGHPSSHPAVPTAKPAAMRTDAGLVLKGALPCPTLATSDRPL